MRRMERGRHSMSRLSFEVFLEMHHVGLISRFNALRIDFKFLCGHKYLTYIPYLRTKETINKKI